MFYYEENGIPPYDELIFIANSKKHDKEAIKKFLRGVELGTQFIVNNPQKSWEVFRDSSPKKMDNELNKRAWFSTINYFALRPAARDTGRYDRYAQFLKDHGDLKEIPPAREYMLDF